MSQHLPIRRLSPISRLVDVDEITTHRLDKNPSTLASKTERGEDQQLLLPPGSLTSRLTSIWSQFQHQQLHRPPTFRAVPPTATLTPSVGVLSDFTLQSNQLIEKSTDVAVIRCHFNNLC